VEVVASLSQGRTAAAQCDLFTYKSVPVIFEPPCICIVFVFICIHVVTFDNSGLVLIYTSIILVQSTIINIYKVVTLNSYHRTKANFAKLF